MLSVLHVLPYYIDLFVVHPKIMRMRSLYTMFHVMSITCITLIHKINVIQPLFVSLHKYYYVFNVMGITCTTLLHRTIVVHHKMRMRSSSYESLLHHNKQTKNVFINIAK